MPTSAFFTIEDYSNERSTTGVQLPEITALNFAGVTQDLDEIRDAIATVILGEIRAVGFTRTYDDDAVSIAPVTDPQAQREGKWLVSYQDTKRWLDALGTISNPGYGKVFTFEVPTADRSLLVAGTDLMDVSSGSVGEDFVTAIEANVKSPYNRLAPTATGDTAYINVLSVKYVGRNT